MKTRACLFALICASLTADAQTFNSGSDGTYGPINITADTTLDMPPSGIFHCTSISVAATRTLRFRRNAANTPVVLLAQNDVNIAGVIQISGGPGNGVVGGPGGPGGFDGGSPGSLAVPPGAGHGPGAGRGGNPNTNTPEAAGGGSFGSVGSSGSSTGKGTVYGNALLIPMIGGSGGGGTAGTPGTGGGGGGGGILIASSTRIDVTGQIRAEGGGGGGGAYNGGSGGGIRMVAPVISGNGYISVDSQTGTGWGRIRVDAIDRTGIGFNFVSTAVTSVGSLMTVFPTPLPRLDVIEAAGTAIAEGSGPVIVQLPFGSSPNRQIKVQARDFNAIVPITLVLTPDHGARVVYTGNINNANPANPATTTFDVVLPVNEQVTVNAYSK